MPPAHLGQPIQIEHLANRHPPPSKQMMVQIKVRVQRREHLKAHGIRRNSRKVVVPEEPQHPFALLNPGVLRRRLLAVRLLLLGAHVLPCLREPDAEKEDVAALEGDLAVACDLLHGVE